MRRILAVLVMAFSLPLSAWAIQSPQDLVHETSDRMITKLQQEKDVISATPGRIYELVNEIVLPHFDFDYMSQLVLAKYWRRASGDQRSAFIEQFRTLLVRTYATSLNEYSDQKINYLPFHEKEGAQEVTVHTEVEQPGAFPIPIDYRLHVRNGEWKVFDVVIDGVSLVTNYRTSFAKEIRQSGIDELVKSLAKRNKEAARE